jgi:hypothetical protein
MGGMKHFGIGLVVGVSLVLAGCKSKPTVVGKWKVDPALLSSQPAGLPPGFMTGFGSTFKYEFKADNTFTGSMSTGTYTLDGAGLSMNTKTLMGQDVAKFTQGKPVPLMTGELAADGQSMVLHPPDVAKTMPALANIKMVPDK